MESCQDLNDMANNDKSIPFRQRNSIPVSVSSPSFGVSHRRVGLRQKFSLIDEPSEQNNRIIMKNMVLQFGTWKKCPTTNTVNWLLNYYFSSLFHLEYCAECVIVVQIWCGLLPKETKKLKLTAVNKSDSAYWGLVALRLAIIYRNGSNLNAPQTSTLPYKAVHSPR